MTTREVNGCPQVHPRQLSRGASLVLIAVCVASALACGPHTSRPVRGSGTITAGGIAFHAITRGSATRTGRLTILFLHGATFTAGIWDQTGLLDRIAGAGYRAIAVDLPGYGRTPDTARPAAEVLAALVRSVGPPERVVLVSPSMSGQFSLAMLAQRPDVRLAGFVPVAPIDTETFRRPAGAPTVPTLAIWGADDHTVAVSGAAALRRELPGTRLEVIPGAGHAAYKDQPGRFGAALLRFVGGIARQH